MTGGDTVKAIDKRALVARLGPVTTASLAEVSVIGIDEFALRRGHRHATVVTDLRAGKVLWVGRGRRREDLRPFFELLGPVGRARIKAVVIDMSGDYSDEVCAQCPQAELVYARFGCSVRSVRAGLRAAGFPRPRDVCRVGRFRPGPV